MYSKVFSIQSSGKQEYGPPDVKFVFILILSSTIIDGKGINRSALRIHLGENVSNERYPYVMVLTMKLTILLKPNRILIKTLRVCTCSLIKPNWVLLAAHCLNDMKKLGKKFFKVIYGDLTIPAYRTKFQANIRKVITHYGHLSSLPTIKIKNDIALLMIDPLYNLPVGKLSAIDYRSLVGFPVTYLGAGATYSYSSIMNKDLKEMFEISEKDQTRALQSGEAIVVPCDQEKAVFKILYPAICLHSKCSNSRQSVMPGDSGGPLLYRDKIIGVSSMIGSGTASSVSASFPFIRKDVGDTGIVYTAVSPFLDWINKVISEERNYTNL